MRQKSMPEKPGGSLNLYKIAHSELRWTYSPRSFIPRGPVQYQHQSLPSGNAILRGRDSEPGNLCLHETAWWGWEDSNLQPNDYQPPALSIEHSARLAESPGDHSAGKSMAHRITLNC